VIPSLAGGGHHGHLGLFMTVQEYAVIAAIPLGVTMRPGIIAQVAAGEAIVAATFVRAHLEFNRTHTTRLNCNEACKKLIIALSANMYNHSLGYDLLGYADAIPMDPLVYLRLTYGHIAPTQLTDC
jgi:hypothetical protein